MLARGISRAVGHCSKTVYSRLNKTGLTLHSEWSIVLTIRPRCTEQGHTRIRARCRSSREMTTDDRLRDYEIRSKNYGKYVRTYSDPSLYDEMLRPLRHLDLAKAEVLDLGSGIGLSSVHLKDKVKAVYYLDYSYEMMEEGLNRGIIDSDKVVIHDFAKKPLPFHAGRFDIVIARYCIHDVEEKLRLFAEINRILRPNGLFQMVDMYAMDDVSRRFYNRIHGWKTHSELPVDTFIDTLETYEELLRGSHMAIVCVSFYKSQVHTGEWVLENQITDDRRRLIEQIVLEEMTSEPSLKDFFAVELSNERGLYIEFPVLLVTTKKEVCS